MAVTPVTYTPCTRNSFSAASIKRSRVLSNSRHSGKGTELTILTGKIQAASRYDLKHGRYDTERSSKMQAWPIRDLLRQLSAPCTWDANLGCVADRAVYPLAKHRLAQRVLGMPVATVFTEIDPAPC